MARFWAKDRDACDLPGRLFCQTSGRLRFPETNQAAAASPTGPISGKCHLWFIVTNETTSHLQCRQAFRPPYSNGWQPRWGVPAIAALRSPSVLDTYYTALQYLSTHHAASRVPALICHCEQRPLIPSSSRDVATSMGLDARRRTAVAAATGLPRCARNDTGG